MKAVYGSIGGTSEPSGFQVGHPVFNPNIKDHCPEEVKVTKVNIKQVIVTQLPQPVGSSARQPAGEDGGLLPSRGHWVTGHGPPAPEPRPDPEPDQTEEKTSKHYKTHVLLVHGEVSAAAAEGPAHLLAFLCQAPQSVHQLLRLGSIYEASAEGRHTHTGSRVGQDLWDSSRTSQSQQISSYSCCDVLAIHWISGYHDNILLSLFILLDGTEPAGCQRTRRSVPPAGGALVHCFPEDVAPFCPVTVWRENVDVGVHHCSGLWEAEPDRGHCPHWRRTRRRLQWQEIPG